MQPLRRRQHSHHAAASGQLLHQPAPCRDQPAGILQIKHPGQVGGHHLADAVTQQQVRLHAPAEPELGQGIAHGKQHRLGGAGLVQSCDQLLLRTAAGPQQAEQRHGQMGIQQGRDAIDRLLKHRLMLQQPASHTEALTALAGEQPGELAAALTRLPLQKTAALLPLHQRLQLLLQLPAVGREADGAMPEVAALTVGTGCQVGQLERRGRLQLAQMCLGQLLQGLRRSRRQAERMQRQLSGIARRRRRLGRIGEHHMGVGAAEPEGTHAHHRRLIRLGEGLQPRLHLQLERLEVNRRIGIAEVKAGRQLAVIHRQRRFDQARDAGGRLGMAKVGLHRTHSAGERFRAPFTQHGSEGSQLERIPLAGAGAVGFHVLSGGGIDAGTGKGLAHAGHLGAGIGRHHAVAAAIGIDGRAMNQGIDRIPGSLGGRQGLEQHHARPLRAHVAIGAGIEALAPAIGRQQPGLAEAHLDAGVNQRLHAAGERRFRFAAPQAFAGQMHRHQRGGAGRIHREAGALEIEEIREPVGGDAAGVAGQHEGFVVGRGVTLWRRPEQRAVVGTGDADEHPHRLAPQGLRRHATILKGAPGNLEQKALLRIHAHGLPRRDAEEGRIELIDAINEAPPAYMLGERMLRIGMEMPLQTPALRGDLADRLAALTQQGPKILRALDTTR